MYKMHHPNADTVRLYVKKQRRRGLSQIEATKRAEIIITAECLKKYKVDRFVNNVTSYKSNQPSINSTIKTAANVAQQLQKSNKKSNTKKAFNTKKQDWHSPNEKMGK
jgi:hypothetical protein